MLRGAKDDNQQLRAFTQGLKTSSKDSLFKAASKTTRQRFGITASVTGTVKTRSESGNAGHAVPVARFE